MHRRLLGLRGLVASLLMFAPVTAFAQGPPTCQQLNSDPAYGLAGNPVVLSHTATLVPAGGNALVPVLLD